MEIHGDIIKLPLLRGRSQVRILPGTLAKSMGCEFHLKIFEVIYFLGAYVGD